MKKRFITVILLLVLLVTLTSNVQATPSLSFDQRALVYVELDSSDEMSHFTSTGLPVYAEMDGGLLTGADTTGQETLIGAGFSIRVLDPAVGSGSYYLAENQPSRLAPDYSQYGQVLLTTTHGVLLKMDPSQVDAITQAGAELRLITPTPMQDRQSEPVFTGIVQPDPVIQGMIDQVDASQVLEYDRQLAGEVPVWVDGAWYRITTRYTYSGTPILKTTHYVGERLAADGLDVEYHVWNNTNNPNVIGELQGQVEPDRILIIGGHLDDVNGTPGADDNASGSVGTLIAADILTQYQWGCTLRFAFWTGEEQGLLGSWAYAQRSSQLGENIAGYLNLDMIAYNTLASPPGIDLLYNPTMAPTLQLANLYADVVDTYNIGLVPHILTSLGGGSDHSSFWHFGYNSILAIEDQNDFNPYYHGSGDTSSNNDLTYFTNFVKASIATYAHMSGCLIAPGWLDGHVTAAGTGDPLTGVEITTVPSLDGIQAITDPNGYYTMTLPANTYTVTAALNGYTPQSVETIITSGEITTQDFALHECVPVSQADFTWQPPNPAAGELIIFTGSSDGSAPLSYTWDFGDGTAGTGLTTTHDYSTGGDYAVVFTATNSCSQISIQHVIPVTPGCQPVTGLDFSWLPLEPFEDEVITFSATASGTEPINFAWDFGDGITGTDEIATHAFAEPGSYPVALSVENACSSPEPVNKDINVQPKPWEYFLPMFISED
jgi:PKD repeat protein